MNDIIITISMILVAAAAIIPNTLILQDILYNSNYTERLVKWVTAHFKKMNIVNKIITLLTLSHVYILGLYAILHYLTNL